MGLLHLWAQVRTAPVGEGVGPMGASGERQASGNPRAPCEVGCERASIRTAAPGHPHGESCASSGRARWPRAASVRSCCDVLRAARGRRWELQPCDQTRAIVWCPVDGAREGFSTSHRLGQSPWRLGKRGRQRHRVGHTHLVRGNVEPAAPSHPRREPCASACKAEARCTVVHPLQACVRVATSCEQREHRRWELGPRCSPHAAAALRVGQRARVSVQP